jgi:4'-phosphopantetheinyl transferase
MGDAGVDVWVRDTNVEGAPSPGMDDAGALDEHERERWARFVDAPAARSYLAVHLLARSQIGTLLGRPPESLRFDRTCPDCDRQHGRPLLVDDPGLHLSLSRSGGVVALALSRSGPVGIDVEQVEAARFEGFEGVALHARERGAVAGAPSRAPSGSASWVRKEAALKALGVGLRVDPTTFVTPRPGVPTEIVPGMPCPTVMDVDAPTGCAAAVALTSCPGGFEVRHH